jgi:hypothetical protein
MQQSPAATTQPSRVVTFDGGQVQVLVPGEPATPQAIYEALLDQRSELRDQLESLEETRSELAEQVLAAPTEGANKAGLDARIASVDQRIATLEQDITAANAAVARAAAVPGAVVEEPPPPDEFIDDDAVGILAFLFFFLVIIPITVAYTRRLWKKAGTAVMSLPADLYERLTRLEQSVDAVALEVERIGEGQRFMTRVLSEHREPQAVPLSAGESETSRR